jgi:hypothetical protein
LCLRSLNDRFVAWTKPDTTSLILGTLTDLARSKSELVAANALLRRHHQGFKLYWKYKSRAASSKPKIPAETVALIKEMAAQNRRLLSRTDPW